MANNVHVTGFHHVAIKVKDFDASLKLYTQVLGFPVSMIWGEGDGRGAMLDTGNGNYVELFAGGSADTKPEGNWLHLALRCTDTKSAIEKVRAAGYVVTMEPADILINSKPAKCPARIAFFKGPVGELIEFFQVM